MSDPEVVQCFFNGPVRKAITDIIGRYPRDSDRTLLERIETLLEAAPTAHHEKDYCDDQTLIGDQYAQFRAALKEWSDPKNKSSRANSSPAFWTNGYRPIRKEVYMTLDERNYRDDPLLKVETNCRERCSQKTKEVIGGDPFWTKNPGLKHFQDDLVVPLYVGSFRTLPGTLIDEAIGVFGQIRSCREIFHPFIVFQYLLRQREQQQEPLACSELGEFVAETISIIQDHSYPINMYDGIFPSLAPKLDQHIMEYCKPYLLLLDS